MSQWPWRTDAFEKLNKLHIAGGQENVGVGDEAIIGNASLKYWFYGKINMEFFTRTVWQVESGLVLFVLVGKWARSKEVWVGGLGDLGKKWQWLVGPVRRKNTSTGGVWHRIEILRESACGIAMLLAVFLLIPQPRLHPSLLFSCILFHLSFCCCFPLLFCFIPAFWHCISVLSLFFLFRNTAV